jgi:hypothetical protein
VPGGELRDWVPAALGVEVGLVQVRAQHGEQVAVALGEVRAGPAEEDKPYYAAFGLISVMLLGLHGGPLLMPAAAGTGGISLFHAVRQARCPATSSAWSFGRMTTVR